MDIFKTADEVRAENHGETPDVETPVDTPTEPKVEEPVTETE